MSHDKLATITFCCLQGRKELKFSWIDPDVSAYLLEIGEGCEEFRKIRMDFVKAFLLLFEREEFRDYLVHWNNDAFITESSIWAWFRLLAHYHHERHFPKFVYFSTYIIRYYLQKKNRRISPDFYTLLMGREFATFIIQEFRSDDIVGICRTSDMDRLVIKSFRFGNRDLSKIYRAYFESRIATVRINEFALLKDSFEASLGEFADIIQCQADFSEESFLHQTKFYIDRFISSPQLTTKALRHVVGFYRWLVETPEGCHIFDSGNLTASLIKKMSILKFLKGNWNFLAFSAIDQFERRRKIVVTLKEEDQYGTQHISGDHVAVDLSCFQTDFYANLVWQYIRCHRSFLFNGSRLSMVKDALVILEGEAISKKRAPTHIKDSDLQVLYTWVLQKKIKNSSTQLIFLATASILRWAVKNQLVKLESELSLAILKYRWTNYRTPPRYQKAIPLADYRKIEEYLKIKAETSIRMLMIYVFVRLLASTPLRPSAIATLQRDSIDQRENGFCCIYNYEKVSPRDKAPTIAHPEAYEWLDDLLKRTSEMRESCNDPDLVKYIFIYKGANGFRRLTSANVSTELERICKELNIERWTPYAFRKLYATILDEIDRKLGYHGELAAQCMRHRSYETTRTHYIDRTMEEFRRVSGADMIGSDEMIKQEYDDFIKRNQK